MRAIVALLLFVTACGGKLDEKRLRGEVQALRAYAAEGRWLADERDELPDAYRRVERGMIADKVADVHQHLTDGDAPPALRDLAAELEPAVRLEAGADTFAAIDAALAGWQAELPP
jgi:hypothetical protein